MYIAHYYETDCENQHVKKTILEHPDGKKENIPVRDFSYIIGQLKISGKKVTHETHLY